MAYSMRKIEENWIRKLAVAFLLFRLQGVLSASLAEFQQPVGKTFKAGASELVSVSSFNATTRDDALEVMRQNLHAIERDAIQASKEKVNIVVFPEYGITGNMGGSRSSIYPYMEEIPDVSASYCVDCKRVIPGREGQTTLGCIAKQYEMYVLANLIESVPCDSEVDQRCPSDNHYQYNTNIVFSPKGCLVAKYHKYHRYQSEVVTIDRPAEPEYVFFDTEFGRFATFICADMLYEKPAVTVVERYRIDHILFSTNWDGNGLPYASAVEWQLAYATKANVNLVGAGAHSLPLDFGSSILSGSRVVNFTSNYKSNRGTLITGDLPLRRPAPSKLAPAWTHKPNLSDANLPRKTANVYGDVYNIVELSGLEGTASVCQKSLCCTAHYKRNGTDETFILGAFSGIHHLLLTVATEICLVYKCGDVSSCSQGQITGHTEFPQLSISAQFSVKDVYPTLLPSEMEYNQLNWTFEEDGTSYVLRSFTDWPIVAAGLVGRDFARDPKTDFS